MKSETQRGHFLFTVSAYGATPFISTEPYMPEDHLPVLGEHGFIGFDLKRGTSRDEAHEVVNFLNKHIAAITCTVFP